MRRDLLILRDSKNIIPELLAFANTPAIGALVDGNDKLLRALQEL